MEFTELILNLINNDEELKSALRGKIAEALSKLDLTEQINEEICESLTNAFEDYEMQAVIEKPITQLLNQTIQKMIKER